MTKQHTPGPWMVLTFQQGSTSIIGQLEEPSDYKGGVLAKVVADIPIERPGAPTEADLADAYLIAAAPDLAEAVREAIEMHACGDNDCLGGVY